MSTLYFPGGGFGFWYLLGIYLKKREQQNENIKYQLVGCSAGSLICLVSLLKEEYINFYFIFEIYHQAINNQKGIVNTYCLLDSLFILIEDYLDYEKLSLNLQNLAIHITEVNFICGCLPHFRKKIIQPENLSHLKKLCLSSCQIPFFGRSPDHCCFLLLDNKLVLDGMFSENQLIEDEYHQLFDASQYSSLCFPSQIQIQEMFFQGYNSN